jgi:hypothetical protein
MIVGTGMSGMHQKEWNRRWYGYWREQHLPPDSRRPSVYDFVDASWRYPQKDLLLSYLSNAYPYITTTVNPCIFGGYDCFLRHDRSLTLVTLTDGRLIWPSDIIHYIRYHDVVIPEYWIEHIEGSNFSYNVDSIDEFIAGVNRDEEYIIRFLEKMQFPL